MDISNINRHIPISNTQTSSYKTSDINPAKELTAMENTQPKKIDFRNITPNEINDLIKSGVIDLESTSIPSNIVAATLPHPQQNNPVNFEYELELAKNTKIDFLADIETSIAFKENVGEDASIHKKKLETLLAINGSDFPVSIKTEA